jgi:Flp pilus assembly protein TadB
MHILIAFVAALWVASLLYRLVPVPAAVDRARLGRVMASASPPTLPFWRALLLPFNALAAKLPPAMALNADRLLYWAQFQGAWVGWSAVEFWGLRLAITLLALALGLALIGDPVLSLVFAGIAWMWPGSRLSGPANRAIRRVEQELPEIASEIALLVGTGKPIAEALRIVAGGQGLMARWLQRVLAGRPADRPLLGRPDGRPGYLREEAARTGVPALINFAVQLDILQKSGVGGEVLLGSLAEAVAAEHQARVMARAEELSDKLTMPVVIFYFLPYLAGLLVPVFAGNMALMR